MKRPVDADTPTVVQAAPRMLCPDCHHARTLHPSITQQQSSFQLQQRQHERNQHPHCHGVIGPYGARLRCDCALSKQEIEVLFRANLDPASAIGKRLQQADQRRVNRRSNSSNSNRANRPESSLRQPLQSDPGWSSKLPQKQAQKQPQKQFPKSSKNSPKTGQKR